MNLRFYLTSAGRKAFAKAVGEIIGCDVVYNGVPGFTYSVGEYIVGREGTLICPESASREEIDRLIAALSERGYAAEHIPEADDSKLTIQMPIVDFPEQAYTNLSNIVASKQRLIMKALRTDTLRIDVDDEKLYFPWFTLTGEDGEMDAYLRFVTALCLMAKTQKRVTAKEQDIDNDKFAMRIFLVRLGMKGPEYKQTRKILLRYLSGNSSWKDGSPPTRTAEQPAASADSAPGGNDTKEV